MDTKIISRIFTKGLCNSCPKYFWWALRKRRIDSSWASIMNLLLFSRNFLPNTICTICGHEWEDILHVFTGCPPAIHIWQHLNIPLPSHNYARWLECLCNNNDFSYHNLPLSILTPLSFGIFGKLVTIIFSIAQTYMSPLILLFYKPGTQCTTYYIH